MSTQYLPHRHWFNSLPFQETRRIHSDVPPTQVWVRRCSCGETRALSTQQYLRLARLNPKLFGLKEGRT
jgi:hypothetical protein